MCLLYALLVAAAWATRGANGEQPTGTRAECAQRSMGACSIPAALYAAKHVYLQTVLSVYTTHHTYVCLRGHAMYHCTVCAGGEAQKALEYLKEHEAETEKLLQDIVAIPSVSALPGMRPVCTRLPHVLPCKKHAQVLGTTALAVDSLQLYTMLDKRERVY